MTKKNDCGRNEIFYITFSVVCFKCPIIDFTQNRTALLPRCLAAKGWGAGLHSDLVCPAVGFLGGPFQISLVTKLGKMASVPVSSVDFCDSPPPPHPHHAPPTLQASCLQVTSTHPLWGAIWKYLLVRGDLLFQASDTLQSNCSRWGTELGQRGWQGQGDCIRKS